jgi:hypothetical protein
MLKPDWNVVAFSNQDGGFVSKPELRVSGPERRSGLCEVPGRWLARWWMQPGRRNERDPRALDWPLKWLRPSSILRAGKIYGRYREEH